ncbi:helix-turn-helix domain-containing protein [Levilactobacillus zymae]|uniref:TetR/AcrR family transcriptional regulator n=1 Tax=Levilactobacillus zymae TaxID=267363 RepID=UPI0028B589F4|nr:helix-turn-helix domain-containing protein [Levilactobacillus zymae]MDT6979353.1 helix-turn-helix domain-containing protein [Levilactobacillus zymae]
MGKNTDIRTAFEQVMAEDHEIPAKQKQVLAASLALFAEQGFANTTTKQIADRAGVAEGTVYRRYKTKDELLAALLKPMVTSVLPRLMSEFAQQVTTMQDLTRHQLLTSLVENRAAFLAENWQVGKVLINEMLIQADLRQAVMQNAGPIIQKTLYPILDQLRAQHDLTALPNDMVCQFIIGTMLTNVMRANLQGDFALFNQRVPYLIEFLDQGLAPK